jgi:hypothetical protein
MGAEYCYEIINDKQLVMTDTEILDAAKGITEQALYDHGHSGYSGTFAEKDSYKIHRVPVCLDEGSAEAAVEELDTSKWDHADIVPIEGIGWYMGGWCSA